MPRFHFTYTPEHLAFGDKPRWVSATDGDTPTLQTPVRMLGMDAPELHYAGATADSPGKFDQAMSAFLAGKGRFLDDGLKQYLKERLEDGACSRQIAAGQRSFEHFQKIATERLDRGKGSNGKPLTPRKLFVMVAREVFDRYGRLLAYVNAAYDKNELGAIPAAKRPTFNLQMCQDGHATSLLIHPNIPKPQDLELVKAAVKRARTRGKGLWADRGRTLLPYEFRWIVDTTQGTRRGPDRYCADMATGDLHLPQGYFRVLPENRLFFFEEDLGEALKMGFKLRA